jgi:hypothetical protein
MADLLGSDFSLAESHKLYRVHELVLAHKAELFSHLQQRWKDLFGARFQVLLYDLTSTYFESDARFDPGDKRRFGYSRDKRNDCVQVVIALVVTPEGFPIAYEVLAGNTADKTTLRGFIQKIEARSVSAGTLQQLITAKPIASGLCRTSDYAVSSALSLSKSVPGCGVIGSLLTGLRGS